MFLQKAEDFLKRANDLARFAGGAFDFISVCPPYELVSYPELYELLEDSPLLHKVYFLLSYVCWTSYRIYCD